jgi:DNA modification methylase
MIDPYYQDSAVTIYHGDCREITPSLGRFDLLLTDPPYGIGLDTKKTNGWHAKTKKWPGARPTKDYGLFEWDQMIDDELLTELRSLCESAVIFGGNFYALPPSSCWLVWDKVNGTNNFADCELAWTNLDCGVRKISYLWNGFQKEQPEYRFHPTQKPLTVIKWCVLQAEPVATILDPFAGSGTTGRAAKDLGKNATLIEVEEKYCEIAAQRMAQEVFSFNGDNGALQSSEFNQMEFS